MIALGIPENKCIWVKDNAFLQFDEVIATSFPGSRRNYAHWVPAYLQTILKPAIKPKARIYVPRSGRRKVINEEEITNIARKYDIKPLIDGQPELFNECELVVGPHGAGLTNIAFCRRDTKVLELIPSDHRFPYYYTLAQAGGLDYYCLMGNSLGKRAETFDPMPPSPYDFYVAPDEFEESLQQMVR
jgi:capsular polysaccharide biosynthesis protein